MKLTTRKTVDDCIDEFIEIKDKLDQLGEGCKKCACAEQFLDNASDPDYAEDDLALECAGTDLDACIASIWKFQRKLAINSTQNNQSQKELVSHSQSIITPENGHSKSNNKYSNEKI